MKILGTGLTGLIGSRIVEVLKEKYEFENLSRTSGIDIADKDQILEKIKASDAQIILHLAGKTDVDSCELDKSLLQNGEAWKINVEGPRNISNACLQTNKKLIYMSTDFIFDGINPSAGGYTEEDIPNPINWYAQTKYEGEKIVLSLNSPRIIIRTAYPYRANFVKLDFFRAILGKLQDGKFVLAITDQTFTPTFIDDIAFALDVLIGNNSQGIFHVAGSQSLTPYAAALLIAETFNFDKDLISKTTGKEFFKDRAQRPFQLTLRNDKILKLGVRMRTFKEGLEEVLRQTQDNKKI